MSISMDQGCQDCSKFIYSLDIQLVDELNQAVAGVPYQLALDSGGFVLKKGTTDAQGRLLIDDLPPKPMRLILDSDKLLTTMQEPHRYLRLSRDKKDSTVKPEAEAAGREYQYLKVGQLIKEAPRLTTWPDDKALPSFHFPEVNPRGLLLFPKTVHRERKLTLEVCPFRAWVLALHHGPQYSLVNAYNLGLMAVLAYADSQMDEHGSQVGSIDYFFGEALLDLSKPPHKVNNQYFSPVVKDVPFDERYTDFKFIDTSTKEFNRIGDTQLFYAVSKTESLITWRGTASFNDVLTDVQGVQVEAAPFAAGKMHHGFKDAYEITEANDVISKAFRKITSLITSKLLYIAGHSLGGALALIDSVVRKENNPLLYTYGMPRVFDRSAVAGFNDLLHFRHINGNDLVPAVPHPKWSNKRILLGLGMSVLLDEQLSREDLYQHQGKLVHFPRISIPLSDPQGWRPNMPSAPVKRAELKTILAPVLVGAKDEKAYQLVLQQYNRAELDNPDRDALSGADHPSGQYVAYLARRLYDRICMAQGAPVPFDKLKQQADEQALHSIDRDKRAQLAAFLQADRLLMAQPLLPDSADIAVANALLRYYHQGLTLPLASIAEERQQLQQEAQETADLVKQDPAYKMQLQARYLEPGERANLPKLSDDTIGKIAMANKKNAGAKELEGLLQ